MATEKDFKIKNGLILNNDNSGARLHRSGNYLKNTTQYGYIQFGPNNTGYAHIDTDRTQFYFSKKIIVDEGIVSSYDEDLVLKRASGTTNQLTIGTSAATFAGNLVVNGDLTINGTTITNSATNTTIEDALIELGSGNTGANSNDLGLILERGTTGDNVFIGWQEANDRIIFATTTATGASTGALSVSKADISARNATFDGGVTVGDSAADTFVTRGHTHLATFGNNVGIGTTSPSVKLEVNGGADAIAKITGTSTAARLDLATTTHHVFMQVIESDGRFRIYDQTAANEYLTISNAGNVGIGTNSPNRKLEVENTAGNGEVAISGTTGADLYFRPTTSYSSGGNFGIKVDGGTSAPFLSTMEFSGYNNGINAIMTLKGDGKVGIGTTAPDHILETSTDMGSSPTNVIFLRQTGTNANGGGGAIRFDTSASNDDHTLYYASVEGIRSTSANGSNELHFKTTKASVNSNVPTTKMVIDEDGNVGIGTTSPSQLLTVSNLLGGASILIASSSSTSAGNLLFGDSDSSTSGRVQYSHSENSMRFNTNGTEQMRIDSSGNVGIGTTSPAGTLHIENSNVRSAVNTGADDFIIETNAYSGLTILSSNAAAGQIHFGDDGSTNIGMLQYWHTDNSMRFTVNASEQMRIDSSGRVGIGTGSPNSGTKVHIAKSGEAYARVESTSGGGARLQLKTETVGYAAYSKLDFIYGASDTVAFSINGGDTINTMAFDVGGSERMRIDSSGRLGIGTTSPTEKLQVNGKIKVSNGGNLFIDSTATDAIFAATGSQFMRFETNSAERMRITNAGNVGIGTTNPSHRLHVSGMSKLGGIVHKNGNLVLTTSSGDNYIGTIETASNGDSSGATLTIYDGHQKATRVVYLAVQNASGTNSLNYSVKGGGGSTDVDIQLKYINRSGTADKTDFYLASSGGKSYTQVYSWEAEGLIEDTGHSSTGATTIDLDDQMALMLLSNGRVGIGGTSSPTATLDINGPTKLGSGSFSGSVDTFTDTSLVLPQTKRFYSLSSSGQYLRSIFQHDGSNGHFIFGQQGTSLIADMIFYPGSSGNIRFYGSGSEDVRINASGLMGIGTTSPSKKLEVVNANSGSNFAGIQLRNNTTTANSSAELRFVISTDTTSTLNSGFIKAVRNAGDNNDLLFGTVGSERMRIDSSGNLQLGSSSNTSRGGSSTKQLIKLASGQSFGLDIQASSTTAAGNIIFSDGSSGSYGQVGYDHASDSLNFYTASTERMRIDSSGRLLIGKTVVDNATVGFRFDSASGFASFARDGGEPLYLNRKTSDGVIQKFAKNDTVIGTIGTNSGNIFLSSDVRGVAIDGSVFYATYTDGSIANNVQDLGASDKKWKDLYLGGTITGTTATFSTALDASITVQSTDATTGIVFTDNGGTGHLYYLGGSDKFYTDGKLAVNGSTLSGGMVFQVNGNSNFAGTITSNGDMAIDTDTLFVDVSTDRVGINAGTAPSYSLHVSGDIYSSDTVQTKEFQNIKLGDASIPANTAGYYKIAEVVRGTGTIQLSFTGGNHSPTTYVIHYFKNWSTSVEVKLNQYGAATHITKARIRKDSDDNDKYFVEVYFTSNSNAPSFQVFHKQLDGYFNSTNQVFTGSLTAGSTNGVTYAEEDFTINGMTTERLNVTRINDNAQLLVIGDTSGTTNVGIGDTSPAYALEVNEASNYAGVHIRGSNAPSLSFGRGNNSTQEWKVGLSGTNGDNFAISTGTTNADRLIIDTNGNVGIGTAPAFTLGSGLEIQRGGTTTLRLENTAASKTVEFNMGTDLEIKTLNSGSDIILTPTANVGIGTTNPSGKLHVYDSGTDTYGTQPIAIFDYYDTDDAALRYSARIGDGSTTFKTFVTSAAPDFLIVDQDNTAGRLAFQVQGNAGNIEALAVDSTGLVGIGTTSPDEKLDVEGNLRLESSSSNGTYLALRNSATNGRNYRIGSNFVTGTGELAIYDDVAGAERMRIDSSGNVGIGITSPAHRLEVAGSIYANAANDAGFRMNGGNNIFRQNSTEMAFETNNTERMRLKATGLGIGETSPTHKLHVTDSQNASTGITIENTSDQGGNTSAAATLFLKGNTGTSEIKNYFGNLYLRTNTNHSITFYTNGANNRMSIDGSGNISVGGQTIINQARNMTNIGSISSTGLVTIDANGNGNTLHIHDDSTGGQPGMVVTTTGNTSTSTQTFYAKQYGSAVSVNLFGQSIGGKAFVGTEGSASGGLLIGTVTSDNIWIGTNNTLALTIDSSQNATFAGSSTFNTITATSVNNRLHAVSIGDDADILLYESSTNTFTVRTGASGAYKYYTFGSGGDFNILGGGLDIGSTQIVNSSRNLINIASLNVIGSAKSVFTNTSNSVIDLSSATSGALQIGTASSTVFATIAGRQTNSTQTGLGFYSATTDANSSAVGDMHFNVRENNNTDFATLTKKAFTFRRYSSELMHLTRGGNLYVAGNVGIGQDPSVKLDVNGQMRCKEVLEIEIASSNDTATIQDDQSNFIKFDGANFEMSFGLDGTTLMKMFDNGALHIDSTLTQNSSQTGSDIKLKKNIKPIDNALHIIDNLNGVHFNWKKDNKKSLGFIAQEVEKILPELVDEAPILNTEETKKTVNYVAIIPVLVEAIKEQQKEIEKLKEHSHPAKDMCEFEGYHELMARIKKLEENNGNN